MELSPLSNAELNAEDNQNRRKSGRVTKAPKYLSPSYSNGSGKRKRATGGEDDGVQDSDSEESGGESSEDDLRDKRRRTKKPQASSKPVSKRAKANGITTTLAVRPAAAKPKKAKKGALLRDADAEGAGGLYGEQEGMLGYQIMAYDASSCNFRR